MPSFSRLDSFECINPRGLVRFSNPLPAKLVGELGSGNEVSQKHGPFGAAVSDEHETFPKLENRNALNELAHATLLSPRECATVIPGDKISRAFTKVRRAL